MARHVALLVPTGAEAAPLVRTLQLRPRERVGGRLAWSRAGKTRLTLALTGMGPAAAARTAVAALAALQPDLVVVAGVAGGLCETVARGDVITASCVYAVDRTFPPTVIAAPAAADGRSGALLSLNRVLITPAEKRRARNRWTDNGFAPPLAVEMETAAVAVEAERLGIAWSALRVVADAAGEALPLDFNPLLRASGELDPLALAIALARRPGALPGMARLGGTVRSASRALGLFLRAWLLEGEDPAPAASPARAGLGRGDA
jgi:nucleoside phosphorylase